MSGRGVLALAALAAVALDAQAGPWRRDRPDADADAEARSALWGELVHPGAAANRVRLDDALRFLRLTTGDLGQAIELLTINTRDAPDDADGWGYLAITAERLRRWPVCATAYAATRAIDPAWRPVRLIDPRTTPRHGLLRPLPLSIALCQGRAGQLDGAAATLAAAIARGEASPELWLRSGEVAMAQGRLDDAIAAFERAGQDGGARWLLAIALDRARRDAAAQAAAEVAQRGDAFAVHAGSTALPALQAGDSDYLLGFAAMRGGRPEYAIAYFRRYLQTATAASPWRPRVAAHLDALAAIDLAERVSIDGGGATALDRTAIVAAIRRVQPALAACMAKLPTGLHEVRVAMTPIIELKPMPWPSDRAPPRSTIRVPPRPRAAAGRDAPAVSAYPLVAPLRAADVLDSAEDTRACLERVAATLRLPTSASGAWRVRIPVVAR